MRAKFIRKIEGWRGDTRLYHLYPAVHYEDNDGEDNETEFVIVSAASTLGPETYIFPATGDGKTINMLELDGSFHGALDHERALRNAGYEVVV